MEAQQQKKESYSCLSCQGFLLTPKIERAYLTAQICTCVPKTLSMPTLAENIHQKFEIWKAKKKGTDFSKLLPNKPALKIDKKEEVNLQSLLAKLEGGATLDDLYPKPAHLKIKKSMEEFTQYKASVSAYQNALLLLEPTESDLLEFEKIFAQEIAIEKHNARVKETKIRLSQAIDLLNRAELNTDTLPEPIEKLPVQVQNWLTSLDKNQPHFLFLYGQNGTGKTTLAIHAAYYAMVQKGIEIRFKTSDDAVTCKMNSLTASFRGKEGNSYKDRWEVFKEDLQQPCLLILDDIGSQKVSDTIIASYSETLDLRYRKRLPTIFTSNFWPDDGIDGKNLKDQIGAKAASRVWGSFRVHLDGPDRRALMGDELSARIAPVLTAYNNAELVLHENECEVVDPEIVKNFQTTGISEGETTSPFFVAHNPVFQMVSDNERKQLTDVEGRDIVLPERRYRDTWNKGDDLSMVGYLLCQNDMLTFLALLEILHDLHREGGRGLSFNTTISAVRKKLGIKSDSKKDTERLLRSIRRLAKTKIEYSGSNRDMFIGGFIDTVYHEGATSQSKLSISMNPAFIGFYKKLSFFKMNINAPSNLSYQARLLYVFLQSQQEEKISFPLVQLAKLYGKQESATKNVEFRRGVRSALDELGAGKRFASKVR